MENTHGTPDTPPSPAPGPPIGATPGWPAGAAERLIELWNGGLSAAQAAARLGTTTRAVECKVHKLRFAGFALAGRRPEGPHRSQACASAYGPKPPAESPEGASARRQCAKRKCLYCGETFASTHIGNRLCPACLEDGPFTSAIA